MTDAENMNEIDEPLGQVKSSRPWLILSLLLVVIAITVLSVISDEWRDNRSIKTVRVFGCSMLSKNVIADLVRDSVKYLQIKDIDISNLVKIVKQNSFVADVRFNPLFNGEFQVFITERVPVAVTVDMDGGLVFSDSYGSVFPFISDTVTFDYPVIRGVIGTERFISTAYLLNRILNENPEYSSIISEIMPGRGKETFDIITSDYGYRIIIDSKSDLGEQLAKYYTFLSSSICGNEKIKIEYIDLRWEKRLVIGKLA